MTDSIRPAPIRKEIKETIKELNSLTLNKEDKSELLKVFKHLEKISPEGIKEVFKIKRGQGPQIHKTLKIPYTGLKRKGKKETFIIKLNKDEYIVYTVPGIISLVNEEFIKGLEKPKGIIKDYLKFIEKQDGMPRFKRDFKIKTLTLCLTSDCNLNCVYCYARGGEKQKYMKWETAKTAIDYAIKNSKDRLRVLYHGGGEPTMAFNMLKRTYEYSNQECDKNNKKLSADLATNGLLSNEQINYLKNNSFNIRISLDGPPLIHNKQRPLRNGKGSYDYVKKTIEKLKRKKARFDVITTITSNSVDKMDEIVRHLIKLGVKGASLNPTMSCGRCLINEIKSPSPDEYLSNYKKSLIIGRKNGLLNEEIVLRLSNTYCGASGENFIVTPKGNITSCLEVLDKDDDGAKEFIYGNVINNKVTINGKKIAKLRRLTISNKKACIDCYCKWNCGGGCLNDCYKKNHSFNKPNSDSCYINREVLKHLFKRLLKPECFMIEEGYDQIALNYNQARDYIGTDELKLIGEFNNYLPEKAKILDIGCGNGLISRNMSGYGHEVIGIDLSSKMLGIARRNAGKTVFKKMDLNQLEFDDEEFNGVIAIQSLIHAPRRKHKSILIDIHRVLKPGGIALISFGSGAGEGVKEFLGTEMYFSSYEPSKSKEIAEKVGFKVLKEKLITSPLTSDKVVIYYLLLMKH